MFFEKRKKLTSHQRAIAITYLSGAICQLESCLLGREYEDTWGIYQK